MAPNDPMQRVRNTMALFARVVNRLDRDLEMIMECNGLHSATEAMFASADTCGIVVRVDVDLSNGLSWEATDGK